MYCPCRTEKILLRRGRRSRSCALSSKWAARIAVRAATRIPDRSSIKCSLAAACVCQCSFKFDTYTRGRSRNFWIHKDSTFRRRARWIEPSRSHLQGRDDFRRGVVLSMEGPRWENLIQYCGVHGTSLLSCTSFHWRCASAFEIS